METNYQTLVKSARNAARDVLRSEKVSALIGYIRNQKAKITVIETTIERANERNAKLITGLEKAIEVVKYETRIAEETNHPEFETIKEMNDEKLEMLNSDLEAQKKVDAEQAERLQKELEATTEAVNEKVTEYEEKIEKWNTGESKVDYERMTSMAIDLVRQRVGASFTQGDYDAAVTADDTN